MGNGFVANENANKDKRKFGNYLSHKLLVRQLGKMVFRLCGLIKVILYSRYLQMESEGPGRSREAQALSRRLFSCCTRNENAVRNICLMMNVAIRRKSSGLSRYNPLNTVLKISPDDGIPARFKSSTRKMGIIGEAFNTCMR